MAFEPGEAFNYHKAASHLLSPIVNSTTGMKTSDFAKIHLFDLIGMDSVTWAPDFQGISLGGEGIFMIPRGMARFGLLYLHEGYWNGKEVISSSWINQSTTSKVSTSWDLPHSNYGFQFWTYPTIVINGRDFGQAFACRGMYEQLIYCFPKIDLVIVFTSHYKNYSQTTPFQLIEQYILPSINE